ncbi:MAG: GNVR domain-containing protein [Candidatus Electronema sp. V4]|uniref:GNVR domain-containing protein n=1 Tax=Candidatus Electronema sp. V4 TaxID=3454756 RepID=UPI00405540F9
MPDFFSRMQANLTGMLAMFFLITLPVAVVTFTQPIEYEAKTSVLIRQGQRGQTDVKTELALLHGNVLAEQILKAVGPERLFPEADEEGRLRQFQQRLLAQAVRNSRIVEITFRHSDPELAAEAANMAVRLLGPELEKLDDPQTALLEEELLLRRKQLQQAQNVLSMFRQNSRLHLPDRQMRHLAIERGRMEAVLAEETRKEQELAGELAELRRQFAAVPVKAEESRNAFLEMKLYQHELLRKYDATQPLAVETGKQLERMRQLLQGGADLDALADWIAHTNAAHSAQKEAEEAARLQLDNLAEQQRQQAEQEKIFSSLEAEVEKNRELHAQQLNKVEASRKAGVKAGLVTVIEQALPPVQPARPKKLRNMLAAVLFGLLGSLLWGCLRQRQRAGG